MEKQTEQFPKGFLWGTSTSAHQVEGGTYNDWTQSEKTLGIPVSGRAVDFYHLYEGDFSLAKEFLHNNAIRLSLEWSRFQPDKPGKFLQRETDHYIRVLEAAKNKGLSPMVTLHHFTDPVWFAEKGGWQNKANLPYFTDYVVECREKLGKLADYWITINEPFVLAGMSRLSGEWPPKKKNPILAARAFFNMAHAHNAAYQILKGTDKPISSTTQMNDFLGFPPAHRLLYSLINHSFLDLTRHSNDFVGIDYYRPEYIIKNRTSRVLPRTDFQWLVDPNGLYKVVMDTWHTYGLPIIIAENGLADAGDVQRADFIVKHLRALKRAIDQGANVKGYFHWSLLDNYEWAEGYKMKFGLFSVDPTNLTRTPRESANVYAKICARNAIPRQP